MVIFLRTGFSGAIAGISACAAGEDTSEPVGAGGVLRPGVRGCTPMAIKRSRRSISSGYVDKRARHRAPTANYSTNERNRAKVSTARRRKAESELPSRQERHGQERYG